MHGGPVLPLLILILSPLTAAGGSIDRIFAIGNSLTWDANRSARLIDDGSFQIGTHVVSSAGLYQSVTTIPPTIATGATDWIDAARSGDWDAYSLQPHFNESMSTQLAAVDLVVAEVGAMTPLFVYVPMPPKNAFANFMNASFDPSTDDFNVSFAAYEYMADVIDAELIPAAAVATLVVRDGLHTVDELYRDQIHASTPGNRIEGHTLYAATTGRYPTFSPYHVQIGEVLGLQQLVPTPRAGLPLVLAGLALVAAATARESRRRTARLGA